MAEEINALLAAAAVFGRNVPSVIADQLLPGGLPTVNELGGVDHSRPRLEPEDASEDEPDHYVRPAGQPASPWIVPRREPTVPFPLPESLPRLPPPVPPPPPLTMAERMLRRAEELRAAEADRVERIQSYRRQVMVKTDERHEELLSAMSSMTGLRLSGIQLDARHKTGGTIVVRGETRAAPIDAENYYCQIVKILLREDRDGQEGRTRALVCWGTGDVQVGDTSYRDTQGWIVNFINDHLRADFKKRTSLDLAKSSSLSYALTATVEMLSPFVIDQPVPDPAADPAADPDSTEPDRKGLDL